MFQVRLSLAKRFSGPEIAPRELRATREVLLHGCLPPLAWVFLKWFTSPEIQSQWVKTSGYFPTRASTADLLTYYVDVNPKWGQAAALLPYGTYEPQLISYQSVRDAAEQAANEILQGADVKATLDALTEEANELQAELME